LKYLFKSIFKIIVYGNQQLPVSKHDYLLLILKFNERFYFDTN
jgi:hypothetical protein